MNEKTKTSSLKMKAYLVLVIGVTIALLLGLEYIWMSGNARRQAYQTSYMLIDQVRSVLATNKKKEQALIDSLKEAYISKAKAVSYIIDKDPDVENDIAELIRIATLMSIDEIHLFTPDGTIYGGTVPPYYGFTFDSGEQMAYFKPMLDNKALSMCQDVTPNTAEGKAMMYSICWNDSANRMIQIGIEPRRLLEELRANEMSEVIYAMPVYDGIELMVADRESGKVLGATNSRHIDMTLSKTGVDLSGADLSDVYEFEARMDRKRMYCSAAELDEYIIVIAQEYEMVNRSIPTVMLSVFAYLMLAALVLVFIVRQMTRRLLEEQRNANTDSMTGFLNRRAYENDMSALGQPPYEQNTVYISADVNGLKAANDTYGHKAGDDLIIGAAQCLQQCIGNYGKLYRIGGDEFAALISCDAQQMERIRGELKSEMERWSVRHEHKLALSCGFVCAEEFPEESVFELAKTADKRMYEEKARYYKENGIDRRCRDRAQ